MKRQKSDQRILTNEIKSNKNSAVDPETKRTYRPLILPPVTVIEIESDSNSPTGEYDEYDSVSAVRPRRYGPKQLPAVTFEDIDREQALNDGGELRPMFSNRSSRRTKYGAKQLPSTHRQIKKQ